MDFDLSPEQERTQKAARDFAVREVAPGAAERDRGACWPGEILARLGALGWLGPTIPAALGGAGLDHVGFALVVEEISAACAGTGAILAAHGALFCGPLVALGTPEQHREILAPVAAGRALGAASIAAAVANRQPDGSFVLQGSGGLVIAGPTTEHFLISRLGGAETPPNPSAKLGGAETPPNPPSAAPQPIAFLVRRGAPGLTVGPPVETMGVRAAHTCSLAFDGVRVPQGGVLGAGHDGGRPPIPPGPAGLTHAPAAEVAQAALDAARVGVAARAVGIARAALEKAAAHVAGKMGRDAAQAIQFLVSNMAVEVDAARLLVLRAARRLDEGATGGPESAVAKLFASEASTRVAHRAMQVFGGEGYTIACGVERHYRDARSTEFDEGTSEVQRRAIAAAVLAG